MTAEDFKKYARDIFPDNKPVKVQSNAEFIQEFRAANKMYFAKKRNVDLMFDALFERIRPIPLQKITRRICGF